MAAGAPPAWAGDVEIWDNGASAWTDTFADGDPIDTGAALWYLPPYSPDLNPIEKMWSKVKTSLCRSKARCAEELYAAVRQALKGITPQDAHGWFESCGYRYGKT